MVLCDVRTPFERAPAVFGPQKGADPATVARLEQRQAALAATWPRDPRGVPMTGAAGGLSGGLWAVPLRRAGSGRVVDPHALDFDARMRTARAVVTGEGQLDQQTLEGKLVGRSAPARARPACRCTRSSARTLDGFGKRMIDLQLVQEATDIGELEAAGERLGRLRSADPRRLCVTTEAGGARRRPCSH